MSFLGDLSVGILVLFVVLEFVANFLAMRAASTSLPNFAFTDKKAIVKAAGIYSVLHILGGFILEKLLALPTFSGTGLLVGYFIDVGLLWLTDLAVKELEIKEKEALFTGAFLMIFCWSVAWFLMLLILGMTGTVDLRPISTI